MEQHLERATLLLQQRRPELAEQELRTALIQKPQNGFLHAMLAMCLLRQDKARAALAEADAAVHHSPAEDFGHYARSCALRELKRIKEAVPAILEAIRLDPTDADYHSHLAVLRSHDADWDGVLAAAEGGLEHDPEHVDCLNLRAAALRHLGRKDEAGETLGTALAQEPENAFTHANQGWALLHEGKPKPALEHFREALRLEPNMNWAQEGVLEALKARNIIYRWILRYLLWVSRFGKNAQWAILGIILAVVFLSSRLQRMFPAWSFEIQLAMTLFWAVLLFSWLAPLFYVVVMRFDPVGQLVLADHQRRFANVAGAVLLAAIVLIGLWSCGFWRMGKLSALLLFLSLGPLETCFAPQAAWVRRRAVAIFAGLLAGGLGLVLWIWLWPATLRHTVWDNVLLWTVLGGLFFFDQITDWLERKRLDQGES